MVKILLKKSSKIKDVKPKLATALVKANLALPIETIETVQTPLVETIEAPQKQEPKKRGRKPKNTYQTKDMVAK